MDEFSLIQAYFERSSHLTGNDNVVLGIGDDAAVTRLPPGHQLVQTIDTLIAGRHFPLDTPPFFIAAKSLAVNLSDLAAMAATPLNFLLSLTLPAADESFLREFSRGLFAGADRFGIELVGGDTCRGELSITIQANGSVEHGQYVSRHGARPGDAVYVSGELGTAALGLASLQGRVSLSAELHDRCVTALNDPIPRLDLAPILAEFASAAIDISDGLLADLEHILLASKVGASVQQSCLPVCDWIRQHDAYHHALSGGDDYQLLFTVPSSQEAALMERAHALGLRISRIGEIVEEGLFLKAQDESQSIRVDRDRLRGFNHFGA